MGKAFEDSWYNLDTDNGGSQDLPEKIKHLIKIKEPIELHNAKAIVKTGRENAVKLIINLKGINFSVKNNELLKDTMLGMNVEVVRLLMTKITDYSGKNTVLSHMNILMLNKSKNGKKIIDLLLTNKDILEQCLTQTRVNGDALKEYAKEYANKKKVGKFADLLR